MSNILLLNQPFVSVAPGVFTYTVPSDGLYNVQVQGTVPQAVPTGDGAGSGSGLGSGTGGGGEGFVAGDQGTGHGGVGQGFGAGNNYQQPPAYGSNETSGPAVSSSVSVTITQNASLVYTSPALSPTQSAFQFKFPFSAAATDAIVVTIASAAAVDNQLNTVQYTVTLGQGA